MSNIKKIALFISLTILLNAATWLLFNSYVNNNSKLVNIETQLQGSKSFKYLFTGDSHVVRCVDADNLENAFNCAYYGENPVLTYYKIKHLIYDLNVKPEKIVLEVDITRFCKNYIKHFKNKFYYGVFTDYNELLHHDVISNEEYITYSIQKLLPHLEMISVIKRSNNQKHDNKFTFKDVSAPDRKKQVEDFILKELMPNGCDDLTSYVGLQYFEKTIELCQKNDVDMVAIKYPVTDYYIDIVASECKNINLAYLPQDSILAKYNIPLFDLETAFADDYELYSDGHHMNKAGQRKVTKLLNEVLYLK